MMNICFINTNKAWGGGEKWHYEMAKKLNQLGHNVTVITNTESELLNKIKTTSIQTKAFQIGKFSFLNPFTYKKIKNYLKQIKPHAVLLNLPSDVKTFSKPAFDLGVKKIIYRRGMNHPIKASIINKYIYRNIVTDIIANSEDVKTSIYKNIPELERKITVIFNGIRLDQIQSKISRISTKKILIGNLGRLVEQKGQKDLIKLAKILKEKRLDFHLYIAGEGHLREELEQKISTLGLKENITLLGMVNPEELFNKIDSFIFTSRFEGLSNALLEALQFRKPIICYDNASNSEVVIDQENGFLVPARNTQFLADKIIELHRSKVLFQKMQARGKETLIHKFDQDKMIKKLEELLK